MIIEPHLIGPGLLNKSFNHQLNGANLLVRLLLLQFATRCQLRAVSQQRLLQTKMFQRGHKAHRRNQLVFADILPAFILWNALLQQAQLQRKFRHLGIIQIERLRNGCPSPER